MKIRSFNSEQKQRTLLVWIQVQAPTSNHYSTLKVAICCIFNYIYKGVE